MINELLFDSFSNPKDFYQVKAKTRTKKDQKEQIENLIKTERKRKIKKKERKNSF
jgi:hypothetical protein